MADNPFTEDYYLRGPEKGLSNYQNYHWLPDLTLPLADHLTRALRAGSRDTILDFGCARGYLVKALRMRGADARGYDISEWAIANCDPEVRGYVSNTLVADPLSWDHIVMKDVAEHIDEQTLAVLLARLFAAARKSVLLVVPLSKEVGYPYLRDEDNADVTHVIRWPLEAWMDFLHQHFHSDWGVLTGSWHIPGIKPASNQVPKSCGFFQFTRV